MDQYEIRLIIREELKNFFYESTAPLTDLLNNQPNSDQFDSKEKEPKRKNPPINDIYKAYIEASSRSFTTISSLNKYKASIEALSLEALKQAFDFIKNKILDNFDRSTITNALRSSNNPLSPDSASPLSPRYSEVLEKKLKRNTYFTELRFKYDWKTQTFINLDIIREDFTKKFPTIDLDNALEIYTRKVKSVPRDKRKGVIYWDQRFETWLNLRKEELEGQNDNLKEKERQDRLKQLQQMTRRKD